jgi:hypothetical protein
MLLGAEEVEELLANLVGGSLLHIVFVIQKTGVSMRLPRNTNIDP